MSEVHSSITDGIKNSPDDVHVFISYSHDDKELAECVRDELKKANPDRVTFFWTPIVFVPERDLIYP
jgi:hypothetical protein